MRMRIGRWIGGAAVVGTLLILGALPGLAERRGPPEDLVCVGHVGDDGIVKVLLPEQAVDAHLAHGDSLDTGCERPTFVDVCHRQGRNGSKNKTLLLPESAVPAHLAHGDFVGTCPD